MKFQMSDLIVGIFVLAAVAIAVGLVMANSGNHSAPIDCVGYFDDVALLEKGAKVAVNGLPVGKVTSIQTESVTPIDGGESKIKIKVLFTVTESVFKDLRAGTKAVIEQESFLGGKFLKINPVTSGESFEEKNGRYLFANTGDYSDPFGVLKKLGGEATPLIDELKKTVATAKRVLESVERADLEKILGDADTLLKDADKLVNDSDILVNDLKSRLLDEGGTMSKVELLLDDTEKLVVSAKDDISALRTSLDKTLSNANDLMAEGKTTIVDLREELKTKTLPKMDRALEDVSALTKSTKSDIAQVRAGALTTMGNVDDLLTNPDLYAALSELRSTMREMKLLMQSLRANPSQVIFGGPGEVEAAVAPKKDKSGQFLSGRGKRYDPDE